MMNKIFDLLKEGVLVQGLLTLAVVCSWLFMMTNGIPVTQSLLVVVSIVIGFYFGGEVQIKTARLGKTVVRAARAVISNDNENGNPKTSLLDEFVTLLKESVLVQGLLTLAITSAWLYLQIMQMEVPQPLLVVVSAVIGYYFGGKSQLQAVRIRENAVIAAQSIIRQEELSNGTRNL
jgi:hypothetical protein